MKIVIINFLALFAAIFVNGALCAPNKGKGGIKVSVKKQSPTERKRIRKAGKNSVGKKVGTLDDYDDVSGVEEFATDPSQKHNPHGSGEKIATVETCEETCYYGIYRGSIIKCNDKLIVDVPPKVDCENCADEICGALGLVRSRLTAVRVEFTYSLNTGLCAPAYFAKSDCKFYSNTYQNKENFVIEEDLNTNRCNALGSSVVCEEPCCKSGGFPGVLFFDGLETSEFSKMKRRDEVNDFYYQGLLIKGGVPVYAGDLPECQCCQNISYCSSVSRSNVLVAPCEFTDEFDITTPIISLISEGVPISLFSFFISSPFDMRIEVLGYLYSDMTSPNPTPSVIEEVNVVANRVPEYIDFTFANKFVGLNKIEIKGYFQDKDALRACFENKRKLIPAFNIDNVVYCGPAYQRNHSILPFILPY